MAKTDPTSPRKDEETRELREVADLRGRTTTQRDASAHRRHTWLYEDLLN